MAQNDEKILKDGEEDINIAKEANTLLLAQEKELKELRLKLARAELYKTVEPEKQEVPFDPSDRFNPKGKTNREIAEYAVRTHDYHISKGVDSPLGPQGDDIAEFLRSCIDESDGDNQKFLHIYQTNLGKDTPEANLAYKNYLNKQR